MSSIDEAARSRFEEKMTAILNGGMLALMTSIGRRTGLFEVMKDLPASTSSEIASEAALDERHVREWLGAMTTGGIVRYDADTSRYILPAEHAALLCNSAGAKNMARYNQYVSMMALVEDDVVDAFRNGGGVPYEKYPRFQSLMAESSALRFDELLTGSMIPLTGLEDGLRRGIDVLDIGCGKGHALHLLAKSFPHSKFVGYDLSEEAIASARAVSKDLGIRNAEFEVQDLEFLGDERRYDLITAFDVIHDQAQPATVLKGVGRALRDNGVFLMMDVRASSRLEENMNLALAPFLYSVSTMHCMTVSLAREGEGLGTVWGEEKAMELLELAGFSRVTKSYLASDKLSTFYVARK